MSTVAQVLRWQPDVLAATAESLTAARTMLIELQDEIDAATPPPTWVSASADTAQEAHGRIREGLNDLVAAVAKGLVATDTAEYSIRQALTDLQDAIAWAEGNGLNVNYETGKVWCPLDADSSDEDRDAARQRVSHAFALIRGAVERATAADAELAGVLNSIASEGVDGGSGTLVDAAEILPMRLRGMTEEELVRYALQNPDEAAELQAVLPPEVREQIGEELADRATELTTATTPLSDAQLGDFETILGAYGDDEVAAAAMLDRIGPEGLLDLSGRIIADPGPDWVNTPERNALRGSLQEALGGTLGAGADEMSDAWLDELTELGETQRNLPGSWNWLVLEQSGEVAYTSTTTVTGYQLLGPLLGEMHGSPNALVHIGQAMTEFEQEWAAEHGDLPWGWAFDVREDVISPYEDFVLDFTEFDSAEDAAGQDPMQGLMQGLAHQPEAAGDFFASAGVITLDGEGNPVVDDDGNVVVTPFDPDQTPLPDGQVLANVDYFLTEREWVETAVESEVVGSGDGASAIGAFGDALVSATLGVPPDDPTALTIVDSTVDAAYNDETTRGYTSDSDRSADSFQDVDVIPPEIRQDVAQIISGHIGSVHNSLGAMPIDALDMDHNLPSVDSGVRLDPAAVTTVLADLGKDPVAHQLITMAELAYSEAAWTAVLEEETVAENDPDEPLDTNEQLADVSEPTGRVLGALDFGATTGMYEEYNESAADANAVTQQRVETASQVLDLGKKLPIPGVGPVVDGITTVLGLWEASVHVDNTGIANYEVGAYLQDSRASVMASTFITVFNDTKVLVGGGDPAQDLPLLEEARHDDPSTWDRATWLEFGEWRGSNAGELAVNAAESVGASYTDGYLWAETVLLGQTTR